MLQLNVIELQAILHLIHPKLDGQLNFRGEIVNLKYNGKKLGNFSRFACVRDRHIDEWTFVLEVDDYGIERVSLDEFKATVCRMLEREEKYRAISLQDMNRLSTRLHMFTGERVQFDVRKRNRVKKRVRSKNPDMPHPVVVAVVRSLSRDGGAVWVIEDGFRDKKTLSKMNKRYCEPPVPMYFQAETPEKLLEICRQNGAEVLVDIYHGQFDFTASRRTSSD